MEGDVKHVQILREEWGLTECAGVETPTVRGERTTSAQRAVQREEISKADATRYGRGAARVVYLAQDCVDVAFAAKDLAT